MMRPDRERAGYLFINESFIRWICFSRQVP
jgi:hypothetical protein